MEYYLLYFDWEHNERMGEEFPGLIYAVSLGDIPSQTAKFLAYEYGTALGDQFSIIHEYESFATPGDRPVYVIRPVQSFDENMRLLCAKGVASFEENNKNGTPGEVILFMQKVARVAKEYRERFSFSQVNGSGFDLKSATDDPDERPPIIFAASGKGIPITAMDASQEEIEWANGSSEVIVKNEEPIAVRESPDSPVVEALKEVTAAVKANTAAREDATFRGAFHAMARFKEPDDEVDIEKVHRLKADGWSWKNIVKAVWPDTAEEDLASEIDRMKKQYQREYGKS